jgi:hypothetical protein
MHETLPGLLDGQNKGYVGSPFRPLALANLPGVGAKGFGPIQTLINMSPDTDHGPHGAKDPMKLGRVPRVVTATIYGIGGAAQGPLVGIAQWGSGNGAQQRIEFDIPLVTDSTTTDQAAGGACLSVPCTALTIQARNDGNLLPRAGDSPIGSIFAPVSSANSPAATCSVALGHKPSTSSLTRTIWAVNGGAGLAGAGSVLVSVPAWAQRFRVLRFDAGNTIQVTTATLGSQTLSGPINEAANAPPSVYAVPSGAATVQITNTGAAPLTFVAILFELGL